ncbi:MAG: isoleucine--tRNA ligase [Gemmatimonadetes bacterium]|nr:isoleucine--tRNA ligase [Gemmatimonadota bacterium]
MHYPFPPATRRELEASVLATWRSEETFRQSLAATADGEPFVFYEGPPTANGRPGLHHIISRAIKDLVCRYQTMRGRHVTRMAGWDTHGLPVEIEAQRQLGIEDKREIEERGIAWFNERCRESVFAYKEEWERFSERIGYWLDYSRPYVTFHTEYIESVWWVLKELAGRGLLYRGRKVVPWCPKDQTVLSSHELSLGYRDVEDPSLWITLDLLDGSGRRLLVWTTTPWTLVANVALAVNPQVEYVEVENEGRRIVVAAKRATELFGEGVPRRPVDPAELIGARYRRPFEVIESGAVRGRAWEVVAADFVSDEEGSGIVHMAPAYGADDHRLGEELGLAVIEPLEPDGTFAKGLPLVGGAFFKDADEPLTQELKARGLVFRSARASHSYPHCWRCDTPLLYLARSSWFARTSSLTEELLDGNERISWHPPEVGAGRFGEWLKGNVDWALSRDRYWGTPLPVWVSDDDPERAEWIGSIAELAERAGGLPDGFDPHRPFIDEVTWRCPETGSTMRRTPEVLDVWFDSGAMPWAQWHYPFENRELFERHYPADFICEAVDQTRGWFYSLHAIATMLGAAPAFRSVIVNDLILDARGRKMSKSRGNVVDPWDAVAEHGADAIRWYMVTVSNPWLPTRFDPEAVRDSSARFFDTLLNIYKFFALYASVEEWSSKRERVAQTVRPSTLDRWLLSRLSELVAQVRGDLDSYNPTNAYRAVQAFVDGELSNWYVRRSRPRFWGNTGAEDANAAFATLHEALRVVALLIAPVTPFVSEWLHRALCGRSPHGEAFPSPEVAPRDTSLESQMADVRVLSTLARAAREEVRIRVRQPLGRIVAVVPGSTPDPHTLNLLTDEINVKRIDFATSSGGLVNLVARPVFRELGQRFGSLTPEAAERIRELGRPQLEAVRRGEQVTIEVGGASEKVSGAELQIVEEAREGWVVRSEGGYAVALDPTLDEPLRREGLARELVNRIQRLRKDSGLQVTDRIRLLVAGGDDVQAAAREHSGAIRRETLAEAVEVCTLEERERCASVLATETEIDGKTVVLEISRCADRTSGSGK